MKNQFKTNKITKKLYKHSRKLSAIHSSVNKMTDIRVSIGPNKRKKTEKKLLKIKRLYAPGI